MELTSFVITFLWSLKMVSSSIRCYTCEPEHTSSFHKVPTCDQFTASEISITHCPNSTMCTKRVTTQDIGPGVSAVSVRRGCAPQTTPGMQEKVGSKWVQLNTIYEVYEEKCIEDPSNKHKLTKTLLCYCRGDLCNRGGKILMPIPMPVTLLITLGIMLL